MNISPNSDLSGSRSIDRTNGEYGDSSKHQAGTTDGKVDAGYCENGASRKVKQAQQTKLRRRRCFGDRRRHNGQKLAVSPYDESTSIYSRAV